MSVKRVLRGLVVSSGLLVATGLHAQTTGTQPAPTTPAPAPTVSTTPVQPPAPVPPAPAAGVTTDSRSLAPLPVVEKPRARRSAAEQRAEVDRHLRFMRGALSKSIDLSATARRDKDVVRLNCIQERVTALKALLRVAEQASVAAQEAASRAESDTTDYELQRVRMARTKAQQMSAEANSCVGEVAVYTGPVQMEVETDPALPRIDPTEPKLPASRLDLFPGILDRPQALSPPM